ncbi:B-cell receptor-associated protein 31, isoform CRA_d [Rattus norvegicus]|uniref:B-cell receptor-associated protein 31, isoform CRA_d n=1 Tax=Rattus norvegicus TaxID=10116 RepID=A6KRW9_RAT|nr:B-cell receptor-associated protein 31, isoform CRA_d [Rattus norvegicus]
MLTASLEPSLSLWYLVYSLPFPQFSSMAYRSFWPHYTYYSYTKKDLIVVHSQ